MKPAVLALALAFVLGMYALGAAIDGPTEYDAQLRTAAAARDIERSGLSDSINAARVAQKE